MYFQAIYGGRISGKKENGLKVNPLYDDVNHASQYADINGNMSPVHVITYETFPTTRDKTDHPENGKIVQNGVLAQHTGVNCIQENRNNNVACGALLETIHNDENAGNKVGNIKSSLVHDENWKPEQVTYTQLNCVKSTTREQLEELSNSNSVNNRIHSTETRQANDIDIDLDNPVSVQHDKGYGLLGFNNESFVSDENYIETENTNGWIELKETKAKEIWNNSGKENYTEVTKKTEVLVKSDDNSIISKPCDLLDTTQKISNPYGSPKSAQHEKSTPCGSPKVTLLEIQSPCELPNVTQAEISNHCESPQTSHTEIVTEVIVHHSAMCEARRMQYFTNDSETDNMCHSYDLPSSNGASDWPDLDMLVRPIREDCCDLSTTEIAQNDKEIEMCGHLRSISDVIIQNSEEIRAMGDIVNVEVEDGETLYKKNRKKAKTSSKSVVFNDSSSSIRELKSILSSNNSQHSYSEIDEHTRRDSENEIQELKSVKFSEDTVFNENKISKYKKEKFGNINLRDLYRGKIMSDAAIAKLNPLYQPEENAPDGEIGADSPTDNEALTYQLTLKTAMKLSKGKVECRPLVT